MLINSKKISYAAIAEQVGMERSGVYRAVKYPWRTKLETYLTIAETIGYPVDEATKEWKHINIEKIKTLMNCTPCEYKGLFKDIKILSGMTYPELTTATGLGKSTVEGVVMHPEKCSWDTVSKVLSVSRLKQSDYYNAWSYAVYCHKVAQIEK